MENAANVIGMESDVNIRSEAVGDLSISTPPPSPMNPGINPVAAARLHYILSKLIRLVPEDEVPELESLQAAIRKHERALVVTTEAPMEITSPQASATAEKAGPTITAHIQHLFQPFTMSVLKVVIEGHSEPVVLKLIDRRFCSKMRSTNEVPPGPKSVNSHTTISSIAGRLRNSSIGSTMTMKAARKLMETGPLATKRPSSNINVMASKPPNSRLSRPPSPPRPLRPYTPRYRVTPTLPRRRPCHSRTYRHSWLAPVLHPRLHTQPTLPSRSAATMAASLRRRSACCEGVF
jgi:hypothetical protein